MSTQSLTPNPRYSHPLRKYDKRAENGSNLQELNAEAKRVGKPNSRKDLQGRRAITELRRMDQQKKPSEMFQDAIAAKNYSLAWQIRSDVETRALGRPYVAINPEERRQEPTDVSRIAIAIKNLQIVDASPKRLSGGSGKVLDGAVTNPIEAAAKPGVPE